MSDSDTTRLADRSPVVVREIVCPDGTQFRVYGDGTWDQHTWDGMFIRDDESQCTEYTTDEDRAAIRRETLTKLGL